MLQQLQPLSAASDLLNISASSSLEGKGERGREREREREKERERENLEGVEASASLWDLPSDAEIGMKQATRR